MIDSLVKHNIEHGVLHDRYTNVTRMSLLFNSTASQCFLYARQRLPKYLASDTTSSVSFFVDDVVPGFWPRTSIRPFSEFYREQNLGLATSIKSLKILTGNIGLKHKLYYAYDLAELITFQQDPNIRTLFNGVRIITRNKEYAKKIYETTGLFCNENHFMMEIDFAKIKEMTNIYG